MEYGVQISNKFKFLSDDESEDPLETLAKAEAAKKDKPVPTKKDKKAAPVPVKPVAASPQPKAAEPEKQQRQANKENESRESRGGARGGRGGGGRGRVNFAERKDVGNRQSETNTDVMGDRFGENRPPRGGVRGRGFRGDRGGFRGRPKTDTPHQDSGFRSGGETEDENRPRGGGGRGFRGGPRRGFSNRGDRHPGGDRHSGSNQTGVRSMPKREGHGRGNWGTENDELAGETEPMAVPVSDTEVPKPDDRTEGEDGAVDGGDEKKADEEEKIKELTLEEWKALQKAEQPNFNTRRAGEGMDQKIYQKLVPIKKEEKTEHEEEVVVVRREPREKPLNIEVSFSTDANRSRGGGGDRFRGGRDDFRGDEHRGGDFRGGRGGGEFRGGRGGDFRGGRGSGGSERRDFRGSAGRGGRRANNFALNDEAFPALGKA